MAANNAPPPTAEVYSTLEVDNRQYNNQAPEVLYDRDNLPEVNHHSAATLPEVNQQPYSATTYTSGGYTPIGPGGFAVKEDAPYTGDQTAAAAAAAAGTTTETKDPRICGVRRKPFIILVTLAALVVVGIIVGVAVGVTVSRNGTDEGDGQGAEDGDSSSPDATPIGPPNNIRLDTRIAATNFTDDSDHNNYVLIYQLNSGALWYVHRISLPSQSSSHRIN